MLLEKEKIIMVIEKIKNRDIGVLVNNAGFAE